MMASAPVAPSANYDGVPVSTHDTTTTVVGKAPPLPSPHHNTVVVVGHTTTTAVMRVGTSGLGASPPPPPDPIDALLEDAFGAFTLAAETYFRSSTAASNNVNGANAGRDSYNNRSTSSVVMNDSHGGTPVLPPIAILGAAALQIDAPPQRHAAPPRGAPWTAIDEPSAKSSDVKSGSPAPPLVGSTSTTATADRCAQPARDWIQDVMPRLVAAARRQAGRSADAEEELPSIAVVEPSMKDRTSSMYLSNSTVAPSGTTATLPFSASSGGATMSPGGSPATPSLQPFTQSRALRASLAAGVVDSWLTVIAPLFQQAAAANVPLSAAAENISVAPLAARPPASSSHLVDRDAPLSVNLTGEASDDSATTGSSSNTALVDPLNHGLFRGSIRPRDVSAASSSIATRSGTAPPPMSLDASGSGNSEQPGGHDSTIKAMSLASTPQAQASLLSQRNVLVSELSNDATAAMEDGGGDPTVVPTVARQQPLLDSSTASVGSAPAAASSASPLPPSTRHAHPAPSPLVPSPPPTRQPAAISGSTIANRESSSLLSLEIQHSNNNATFNTVMSGSGTDSSAPVVAALRLLSMTLLSIVAQQMVLLGRSVVKRSYLAKKIDTLEGRINDLGSKLRRYEEDFAALAAVDRSNLATSTFSASGSPTQLGASSLKPRRAHRRSTAKPTTLAAAAAGGGNLLSSSSASRLAANSPKKAAVTTSLSGVATDDDSSGESAADDDDAMADDVEIRRALPSSSAFTPRYYDARASQQASPRHVHSSQGSSPSLPSGETSANALPGRLVGRPSAPFVPPPLAPNRSSLYGMQIPLSLIAATAGQSSFAVGGSAPARIRPSDFLVGAKPPPSAPAAGGGGSGGGYDSAEGPAAASALPVAAAGPLMETQSNTSAASLTGAVARFTAATTARATSDEATPSDNASQQAQAQETLARSRDASGESAYSQAVTPMAPPHTAAILAAMPPATLNSVGPVNSFLEQSASLNNTRRAIVAFESSVTSASAPPMPPGGHQHATAIGGAPAALPSAASSPVAQLAAARVPMPVGGSSPADALDVISQVPSSHALPGGAVDAASSSGRFRAGQDPNPTATLASEASIAGFMLHRGSMVSMVAPPPNMTSHASVASDTCGYQQVNQYVLLTSIGRGAQGEVFYAVDSERNEGRAIKVINRPAQSDATAMFTNARERAANKSLLERLAAEIQIMQRCRHQNIVTLYEVIDDPTHNQLYLVMQHVEHGALAQINTDGRLACAPFEPVPLLRIARQATAGLLYLHKKRVAHRDIKPENLLRGNGDAIFLADFGISLAFKNGSAAVASSGGDTVHSPRGSVDGASHGDLGTQLGPISPVANATLQSSSSFRKIFPTHANFAQTIAFTPPEGFSSSTDESAHASSRSSHRNFNRGDVAAASAGGNYGGHHHHDDDGGGDAPAAPPQRSSQEENDFEVARKGDVWSLGLTFYVLLVGWLPWPISATGLYIDEVCSPREVDLSVVASPVWRAILEGMLRKDPMERWDVPRVRVEILAALRRRGAGSA